MHFKTAAELVVGDVIKDRRTEVRQVEHDKCGKDKVHINNNACYESFAMVELLSA